MKKTILILIAILLTLAILSHAKNIYSSKTSSLVNPENRISIAHVETFKRLEYGKVIFEHQKHVDALKRDCSLCHEKNQYGEFTFEFPKYADRKEPERLKNAYHEQCLSCHQKLSIEKKKTGPEILACRQCHKKEYETVTLKYPYFEFDFYLHDKHVKKHNKDCSLCHHIYDIEENNKELALIYEKGTEQSCYYCHDLNQKRGPELSKIVNIAKQKNLNIEKSFHLLCINCHLKYESEGKEAGPTVCSKCHTGKYRTLTELKDIPRPQRDQPDKALISVEGTKMKGVGFNHNFHEKQNRNCRVCHHETLKPCKECHDIKGKIEGGFINLLTAYHSQNSEKSCAGCHKKAQKKAECMGCHYFIQPISVREEIASKELCAKCHTGKKDLEKVSPISVEKISEIKQELKINHIEKEFEPAKMPHYKIIKKLTDISNQSKLATYFHRNIETMCKGCHHKSKQEAEAKKDNPPPCVNCHSVNFDSLNPKRPRLQASYHIMCIKCHENMKLEKPKNCQDCHERKQLREKNADI